jgi:hypothetical protein
LAGSGRGSFRNIGSVVRSTLGARHRLTGRVLHEPGQLVLERDVARHGQAGVVFFGCWGARSTGADGSSVVDPLVGSAVVGWLTDGRIVLTFPPPTFITAKRGRRWRRENEDEYEKGFHRWVAQRTATWMEKGGMAFCRDPPTRRLRGLPTKSADVIGAFAGPVARFQRAPR